MTPLNTWHVSIIGRVQGVYYRAHTVSAAKRLGVTGWVQNERDGSVQAVIQHADAGVLSDLLTLLRDGPPASRVDEVNVTPLKANEQFMAFEIRHASPWRDRVPHK
ncbi:acylphosphatase [bacterium]|nr:acylphosphatase [bacterium]